MQNETVDPNSGFAYMQTNEPKRNRLLVFESASDGTLTPSGAYETGGAGDGVPHLNSQGSVVLTGDGQCVFVTNTSSGDMSVFTVGEDGLSLMHTVATGSAPKSVAEHQGLVYVLDTSDPPLTGSAAGSSRSLTRPTNLPPTPILPRSPSGRRAPHWS